MNTPVYQSQLTHQEYYDDMFNIKLTLSPTAERLRARRYKAYNELEEELEEMYVTNAIMKLHYATEKFDLTDGDPHGEHQDLRDEYQAIVERRNEIILEMACLTKLLSLDYRLYGRNPQTDAKTMNEMTTLMNEEVTYVYDHSVEADHPIRKYMKNTTQS